MKISIPELKLETQQLNKIQQYWGKNPYPTLIACGEMIYTVFQCSIDKCNSKKNKLENNSICYYILHILITISAYICYGLPVPDKYRYKHTNTIPLDIDYVPNIKNNKIIIPNSKVELHIDYPLEVKYVTVLEKKDYSLNDLITHTITSYNEIYTTPTELNNVNDDNEVSDREVSDKEVSDKEVSDKEVSDKINNAKNWVIPNRDQSDDEISQSFGKYGVIKYLLHDLELIEFDCTLKDEVWICKPIVRPKP